MFALLLTTVVCLTVGGAFVLVALRPSRLLPEQVREELKAIPMRRRNQHVVDLYLRDGRVVEEVWVAYGGYIALVGGRTRSHRYTAGDVVHATERVGP